VIAPDYYILVGYATGVLEMQVLRRAIESGDLTREGFLRALHGAVGFDTYGATAQAPDYSRVPYQTGRLVRILKPDFDKHSWSIAGGFAPQAK
jgi:hypothetical protein